MGDNNRDDVVLWIVIGFCLLTPVIMTTLWAFADLFYPPMLISVLLGIAIAALSYRYLGGTAGSEFSVGVLKVAGSAALLLGTAYLTNDGLTKQMDKENSANKLSAAIEKQTKVIQEKEELERKLEENQRQLEMTKKRSTEILISEIEKLKPKSLLGEQLVELARKRKGPFVEVTKSMNVAVTVVGYIKDKGKFNACNDFEFAGEHIRFARFCQMKNEEEIKSLVARQAGTIGSSICQKVPRKFDVQISCQDGFDLFPDYITGCETEGSVKWRIPNGDRTFQLTAEVLNL